MTEQAPVTVIIPARMASERFPGKVLASETGWPLIRHVWEQARKAKRPQQVVIATDDARVADAAEAFGAKVVLTSPACPNGTARVAEAAEALGLITPGEPRDDIIVNVQGDEPELEPELIDRAVEAMERFGAPMGTIAAPMEAGEDPADSNIVKVVFTELEGDVAVALYFSRSPIPYPRDAAAAQYFKHIGLYAYTAEFLEIYPHLDASPLEQAEKLEQLRALQGNFAIAVAVCNATSHGIDTPEQYAAFVARWRAQRT